MKRSALATWRLSDARERYDLGNDVVDAQQVLPRVSLHLALGLLPTLLVLGDACRLFQEHCGGLPAAR